MHTQRCTFCHRFPLVFSPAWNPLKIKQMHMDDLDYRLFAPAGHYCGPYGRGSGVSVRANFREAKVANLASGNLETKSGKGVGHTSTLAPSRKAPFQMPRPGRDGPGAIGTRPGQVSGLAGTTCSLIDSCGTPAKKKTCSFVELGTKKPVHLPWVGYIQMFS